MDFDFTNEQKRMRKAARDFLKKECPMSFVLDMEDGDTGHSTDFWRKMTDLDWMALVIPQDYDGVGGNLLDLIILTEEMGRVCVPGPFFSTIVFGGLGITDWGDDSQKREYLPQIANGEKIFTLAYSEPENRKYAPYSVHTTATAQGGGYALNGTKLFVQDAGVSDYFIVTARTAGEVSAKEGITLFIVDRNAEGISLSPLKTIGGDRQFQVALNNVSVSQDNILGAIDKGGVQLESMLEKATICKCAEMIGGAQKVLEMSTDYAKQRTQFGKPIGVYQAVQHHCANMLMDIEGGRYITYKTAWMLSEDIPCAKQVAAAKAWVSDGYKRIVSLGHQVFGALGYIVEHEMPLYSRRASTAAVSLGDSNYCRQLVASELGL